MAALYVHIPFCRSRCIYCGFYSTTLTQLAAEYVEAVCTELNMLAADPCYRRLLQAVRTVYIGGGTPRSSPLPCSTVFSGPSHKSADRSRLWRSPSSATPTT